MAGEETGSALGCWPADRTPVDREARTVMPVCGALPSKNTCCTDWDFRAALHKGRIATRASQTGGGNNPDDRGFSCAVGADRPREPQPSYKMPLPGPRFRATCGRRDPGQPGPAPEAVLVWCRHLGETHPRLLLQPGLRSKDG